MYENQSKLESEDDDSLDQESAMIKLETTVNQEDEKYLKEFDGKGDAIDDAKKGIYHYTIGQDYGLVKSIEFKRNDQPYLRESKSVGKKTIYLGQFRDIYAASIKMVGNNFDIEVEKLKELRNFLKTEKIINIEGLKELANE